MTRIQTIGIVGGGQLGKMMAQSAKRQGYQVIILDPQENCSAAQVSDHQIVAAYHDVQALMTLGKQADIVTFEFENVDTETLKAAIPTEKLPQGTKILEITQHRILEKRFLNAQGIPTVKWAEINGSEDLTQAIRELGYPSVLKTVRFGYDGKGQVVLRSEADLETAIALIDKGTCILEQWVTFEKEVSLMISRNINGETSVFPVAENVHRNNILHTTVVPAQVSPLVSAKVQQYAETIAQALALVGTLGIEYFVTAAGEVYVNELAPRPHNSGHYSIEACNFSQFDTSIQAVCQLPMPTIQLLSPVVMINILGQHLPKFYQLRTEQSMWHFHDYGKGEAKHNRKMGHITALCQEVLETKRQLEEALLM